MYNGDYVVFYSFITSTQGSMLLLSNGRSLTGCYFVWQKYCPQITKNLIQQDSLKIFCNTRMQLEEYFKGSRKNFYVDYIFIPIAIINAVA